MKMQINMWKDKFDEPPNRKTLTDCKVESHGDQEKFFIKKTFVSRN